MGVGGEEVEVLGQDGECDICLFSSVRYRVINASL